MALGYAYICFPLVIAILACLCLPCIVLVLRNRGRDPLVNEARGATEEMISTLPIFTYRKRDIEAPAAVPEPVAPKKRKFKLSMFSWKAEPSPESPKASSTEHPTIEMDEVDAVCAVCIGIFCADSGPYDEGAELRQLPCAHHFHVDCINTWLRINGSCPTCRQTAKKNVKA
jgi:Ring finger domain